MSHRLTADNVKAYVLAGNATITLKSSDGSKHYTYKITKCDNNENLFFVKALYGNDNEKDYRYVGCYFSDTKYFSVCKDCKDIPSAVWPKRVRNIAYFFNNIDNLPDKLMVYHSGTCGRCGRKLTTPESIERGLGPECCKETYND